MSKPGWKKGESTKIGLSETFWIYQNTNLKKHELKKKRSSSDGSRAKTELKQTKNIPSQFMKDT